MSVGHLSQYVTSHPGQLSLAIPSWVGTMSTSHLMHMLLLSAAAVTS